MALRRFQPISRAAQWSEKVRWIDPRTRQANDLTDATLTMALYQDGGCGGWSSDYGRWWGRGPWGGYGAPALAAQTQADGSGPFVILPGDVPTEALFTFPPAMLGNLWPGDALLVIWATVAGATDEIERQTIRVLDGPRMMALPISAPVVVTPPTLGVLSLSSLTATVGVPFAAVVIGQAAGSVIAAVASDGTLLSVANGFVSGTFAGAGSPTITLTEALPGATNSPRATSLQITVSATPVVPAGVLDFSSPANSGLLAAIGA